MGIDSQEAYSIYKLIESGKPFCTDNDYLAYVLEDYYSVERECIIKEVVVSAYHRGEPDPLPLIKAYDWFRSLSAQEQEYVNLISADRQIGPACG